ncbi:hypothetical protein [Leucobacter luti]|uniref:hypothetical protein n=1 Tax=Leucobacter luti TaxID=340320 RepID=UPI003CFCB480
MDRLRWEDQELLAVGAALGDAASALGHCGNPPRPGPLLGGAALGSGVADYLNGLGIALRALAAGAHTGRSALLDLAGESSELDARAAAALGGGSRGGQR